MKFRSLTKRFLVFLLSFLMAFEPFAVNMVRAAEADNSVPLPEVEEMDLDGIDGIIDLNEVMEPAEYLEYTLNLRGRSRGDDPETANQIDEAVAWGEWMNTITGAYAKMDDGCTDVFSFYSALGQVKDNLKAAPDYLTMLSFAANKATLAGAFIAKHIPGLNAVTDKMGKALASANKWLVSKSNLFKGMENMGKAFSKGAGKFLENTNCFIRHMCPPVGWKKGCAKGEGFVSYWRWVARKTGLDGNPKYKAAIKKVNDHLSEGNKICDNKGSKVISDVKGVAQTIGIGLTVVGIAMDCYGIASSEDTKGGRHFSYSLVKNYVSLALGIGSLVAMFCIPVVGQILGVISIVWMCLTAVGDELGEYNKKWKEAYKNSYWFLYNNDPEFKSYYDNREDLAREEKSAAYLVTEYNYGEEYKQKAYEFLKANKGENNYYDDKSQEAVSARVYIELEKQGVVSSYYNRSEFKLPEYSLSRLMEFWKMKADYMSWKPNEEESVRAENRGFWGKVGHAINPMTYVSWAGDKIKSSQYKNTIDKYNVEKVYCCPDFCLQKKYMSWITANRKLDGGPNDSFYRTIGLRIEQSPFNYIPLVGIDSASWNADLLVQAFNADAFFVGVKEMVYIADIIEGATTEIKERTKNSSDIVKEVKSTVEDFELRRDVLAELRNLYRDYPDDEKKGKEFFKDKDGLFGKANVKKAFGWNWNRNNGKCTPRNIAKIYWNDINNALTYDPLSISQKAAELVLIVDAIKHNLDTAEMMKCLLNEKREALATFDTEFTNIEFNEYLKKGSFLNVKGSTFMDWLSELSPAYSEMEYYANIYEKNAKEFQEAADESNEGHKKLFGFLWQVKDDDYHPNKVIEELNGVLNSYKSVLEDFEDLKNDLGEDGLVLLDRTGEDGIFVEYPTREINVVDVNKEVVELSSVIPE